MSHPTLIAADQAATLSLPSIAQAEPAGIVSRTVLQTPPLRVVHFTFAPGQELTPHSSPRRALVEILSGSCEFLFNGEWQCLEAGTLLHLPPGHPHAVRAGDAPFSMLLSMIDVTTAPVSAQ